FAIRRAERAASTVARRSAMYRHDPIYPDRKPVTPVRLWLWVLNGVLAAVLLWAYLEPIPAPTNHESVQVGPDSPLYGPIQERPR
ncbi:MAG: hypothetical protein ACYCZR_01150, partial [Burkholderiales bacterium]